MPPQLLLDGANSKGLHNLMSWETRQSGGRYYTRSRRVNGQIVREYVGTGIVAELANLQDQAARADREAKQEAIRATRQREADMDGDLNSLEELADLVARGLMIAAGYYQHNRGTWRKRNDQSEKQSAD